jgi:hypothetical protein
MATETTLRLVFDGNSGKKVTFAYPCAKSGASAVQVKTLMQVMVANGDIFSEVPRYLSGAEFVSREVTAVDIS